ncbi:uncharacterized protein LOC132757693 [Ruditapes philippinarum]|uniref:uncharacterized protein LOC132757693 n=1 Tax=Ruditapes philippinarum TaxID=129788 RepID=UPI00295B40D5|nr:uncharacterized protein LOC132757693 [Ruditapes philippinarum]
MESKLILMIVPLVALCSAQLIIPKRPLGYVYAAGSNNAAIHIDIHMGPLCPDSRDALPVARQVAEHYGATTLKLTLHMFPLPYHHQSFITAKGAQIIRKLGAGDVAAYSWFEYIYANLDKYSNDATANLTTNNIITMFSNVAHALGVDSAEFIEMMKSDEIETATRAAWKYSCSRAIAGTPTYLVNDVIVEADPSWTLKDWQQVIDPLLKGRTNKSNKDCPTDTKKCEYLPGKVECCTKGEACIPNVGCRCFENSCSNGKLTEMFKINPVKN